MKFNADDRGLLNGFAPRRALKARNTLHSKPVAGGFTLIELLIAAGIAALLMAVIFGVYGSTLNTITAQNRWRQTVVPAAEAMDALTRDLACALIPYGVTNSLFESGFIKGDEEQFELRFYSAFPTATSNDWRGYSISLVCYSFNLGAGTNAFILTRECVPFRVPSRNPSASGREQWRGIKRFEIEFSDGSSWTNRWGSNGGTNCLPQAARIVLGAGHDAPREIRSEVFINAAGQLPTEKLK